MNEQAEIVRDRIRELIVHLRKQVDRMGQAVGDRVGLDELDDALCEAGSLLRRLEVNTDQLVVIAARSEKWGVGPRPDILG